MRFAVSPLPLQIAIDDGLSVAAMAIDAQKPIAALVLAHGADAGMTHPFMQALAKALAVQRIFRC